MSDIVKALYLNMLTDNWAWISGYGLCLNQFADPHVNVKSKEIEWLIERLNNE